MFLIYAEAYFYDVHVKKREPFETNLYKNANHVYAQSHVIQKYENYLHSIYTQYE